MRFRQGLWMLMMLAVTTWVGCGGYSSNVMNNPTVSGASTVSLTMGDTPPTGVTILSFELKVTSAALNPHDPTHAAAQLLSAPVEVEVSSLEVDKAFLNTSGVPADTYDGITVTFANPELTFLNSTGATLAGCANGAVCKIEPALNPATVKFSGAPFPVTLSGNSMAGLLLDFNLDASIQGDLSVSPVISLTQLALVQGQNDQENEQEMEEIEDVVGQISSLDSANKQFTLLQASTGQSMVVKFDANTQFSEFDEAGLANDASALAQGQVVQVDLGLMTGGGMLAKKIELRQSASALEEEFEGTVTSVDSSSQVKVVVVEDTQQNGMMQIGNQVTVTIQTGAQFSIDSDGLSVPSDLVFGSGADLLVGQTLDLHVLSGSTSTSAITDRVRLRRSHLTAQVSSLSGSDILVNSLPALFSTANPPISQITARTSSETQFEDVSGLSGLAAGNTVSLRGLLFKTSGDPILLADTVRLR